MLTQWCPFCLFQNYYCVDCPILYHSYDTQQDAYHKGYFFGAIFNSILLRTHAPPEFYFSDQNVCICHKPHARYMPFPAYASLFDHPQIFGEE
jgi:hypothetical protein